MCGQKILKNTYESMNLIEDEFPIIFEETGHQIDDVDDHCSVCGIDYSRKRIRANVVFYDESNVRLDMVSYCEFCNNFEESTICFRDEIDDIYGREFIYGLWIEERAYIYSAFNSIYGMRIYFSRLYGRYKKILVFWLQNYSLKQL